MELLVLLLEEFIITISVNGLQTLIKRHNQGQPGGSGG